MSGGNIHVSFKEPPLSSNERMDILTRNYSENPMPWYRLIPSLINESRYLINPLNSMYQLLIVIRDTTTWSLRK